MYQFDEKNKKDATIIDASEIYMYVQYQNVSKFLLYIYMYVQQFD